MAILEQARMGHHKVGFSSYSQAISIARLLILMCSMMICEQKTKPRALPFLPLQCSLPAGQQLKLMFCSQFIVELNESQRSSKWNSRFKDVVLLKDGPSKHTLKRKSAKKQNLFF